jgi:hypothetical protein
MDTYEEKADRLIDINGLVTVWSNGHADGQALLQCCARIDVNVAGRKSLPSVSNGARSCL